MPSRRHNSAMLDSPRKPSRTIRIFSSDECRLRVARRMFFTIRSDGDFGCTDFSLISHSLVVTMSRRENLNQANKLSRTYATLVESLNRHRGKGQQKVTVEHVHVHDGGHAIVGNVEGQGGGFAQ